MKTKNLFRSVLMVLTVSAFLFSCNSAEELEIAITATDEANAVDNAYIDGEIDEVEVYVEDAFDFAPENGKVAQRDTSFCATIVHDTLNKVITLDFGTGCVGPDGRTRSGIIEIAYTGRFARDHRGARTVEFTDYTVDGNSVDGKVNYSAVAFQASDSSLNTVVTATNLVFSFTDNTTFSFDSRTRNRKWKFTVGEAEVYGAASGTNRLGKGFTSVIPANNPLLFKRECGLANRPFPVPMSGVKTVQVIDRPTVSLDFGDGSCDRKAILTVGNRTREIILRR